MAASVGASEPRSSSFSQEVDQRFVVIEEANLPSKMRREVMPSVEQSEQAEQAAAQPLNLPLVPSTQERSMVERIKTETVAAAPKRTEHERDFALVTDSVVPNLEGAPPTTPMPIPAFATASQEIPTTPNIAKSLLLLTCGPKFDKTVIQAESESTKSSAGHTDKVPSGEPPTANAIPDTVEVQLDLILANQHQIMANQLEQQANQHALERRMDKMEHLLVLMLKVLKKGRSKGNQ